MPRKRGKARREAAGVRKGAARRGSSRPASDRDGPQVIGGRRKQALPAGAHTHRKGGMPRRRGLRAGCAVKRIRAPLQIERDRASPYFIGPARYCKGKLQRSRAVQIWSYSAKQSKTCSRRGSKSPPIVPRAPQVIRPASDTAPQGSSGAGAQAPTHPQGKHAPAVGKPPRLR